MTRNRQIESLALAHGVPLREAYAMADLHPHLTPEQVINLCLWGVCQ